MSDPQLLDQPHPAAEPVLSVRELNVLVRSADAWRAVVKRLCFDIGRRETVAIVGESGSGKSMTALAIMRLLAKAAVRVEGEARLNGQDLLALPEKRMRDVRGNQIAMIFQEPMTCLNPTFTIGRQLAETLLRHRRMSATQAKAASIELLEKVRIPNAGGRIKEYPHQFSGGMRQRVMIAMALASRPQLLIADEPTTALDVTIQGQILDLIKTLQQEEEMAVLFITHDMAVVAEIAERTLVMYRGELVESGPTEEIFQLGRQPYTRALIEAVPRLGSMSTRQRPLRFPLVDIETGRIEAPTELAAPIDAGATPILSVRNLITRFDIRSGLLQRKTGAVHAVENVSFDLAQGETLALVGESGCGKSTTGRSIMRLVEPCGGEVQLDGYEVLKLGPKDLRRMRRSIQMIFQDPFASLNPRMSVGQAICEPFLTHRLGSRSQAREHAAELLERVGLSAEMMRRYPHEFSGGQRQRISIARALAVGPKVIVADESVSALDVSIKAQVCNLLLDLQQSLGISLVFISHDMAVVERVSHRVAVMRLGEIVEIGPRAAVFGNPQHSYTKKLLAAVPVPDPSRRGIKRNLAVDELKSPIRTCGYRPPERSYRAVAPGHWVQQEPP